MTIAQEDALYEFLDNARKPFTLKDITQAVRSVERTGGVKLATQIALLLQSRRLVFESEKNYFLSRRALFEKARFVIQPSNSELMNGVLIPGHRCVPFVNPLIPPHQYTFYFREKLCPVDSLEGAPEDFYPYYSIFGEEYAPHYIAGDNKENETAFSLDPDEEPPEVSIRAFDMRAIFREIGFVPGDRFVATARDWKTGSFDLEHVKGDAWSEEDLHAWTEATEKGFFQMFENLGPGFSCEEQLAWAFFYGGERMRRVPAYSLEDFLFRKTEKIDTVPFGIETRFWWTGKDIPDFDGLRGMMTQSDQTPIEDLLARNGIPVSEFVLQAFARDALYRNDVNIGNLLQRIIPPSIRLDRWCLEFVCQYLIDILADFASTYSIFKDKVMGPIRQRVGELHTAVIDLSARLTKGEINKSWLPMHTFIVLSQIQNHSASLLEDLDMEDELPEQELAIMDATLDTMIDTYEDVREMVDEALSNFRQSNFSLVKTDEAAGEKWLTVQLSLGGTDIWRRAAVPAAFRLFEMQRIIHAVFSWSGHIKSRFTTDYKIVNGIAGKDRTIDLGQPLGVLAENSLSEFLYEYGLNWTVKVMVLSKQTAPDSGRVSCLAGEGVAPNEKIEGPLRYRRLLSHRENGSKDEQAAAAALLGEDYDTAKFDIHDCNRMLKELFGE
ncbi:MAG: plasmid pRiA4b ORF-3 family protein [Spirochaetaceae bacterium]|nr:plasmid pRiA4b ORF-3 family protein [Spirochaetaceae bacterium]